MKNSNYFAEAINKHHLYITTDGKQGTPANLNCSMLYDAIIEDVNLNGIFFNDAKLMRANFRKVKLQHATFAYAYLREASFTNCIMSDVSFNNANLTFAVFKNVDLSYALFKETDLTGANLSIVSPTSLEGINLTSAILDRTIFPKKNMKLGKLYSTVNNKIFLDRKIQGLVCLISYNESNMDLLDSNGIIHKNLPFWLKFSMKEV
jgi:uncharacterized protein YjbI with pentapeptide repeats